MRYERTPNSSVKVKKHSFIYRLFSGFSPEADGFYELPSTKPYIMDDFQDNEWILFKKKTFYCRNI